MVTDPPVQSPAGTVYTTTTFSLTADVAGALPMTFQWKHEGTNVPGATAATYTRANAVVGDAGNYVLWATNAYGATNSMAVAVTVPLAGQAPPSGARPAARPAAALGALANGRRIDVVFSDIMMSGGMSGLELGREIRRRHPELRVVLTTGYSESAASMSSGEFPLLLKPYSLEGLSLALGTGSDSELAARREEFPLS
jgi:CheY-like chemotaxis protein